MKTYAQSSSLYQPMPHRETGADADNIRAMDEVKDKAMDQILWASSQSFALAKLKLFGTMAKMVNDQQ